jgi:uncharacterized membrane protein (UPF0127 family)
MITLLPLFFFFLEAQDTLKIDFKEGVSLQVEVAATMRARNKGLMDRTHMAKDHGMLFVFERPQRLSFWMKDTYIPLSIAYIDKNKVIKEIYDMKPQNMMERTQDLQSYPSQCDCLYALEVNRGWFQRNKIKVGDTLRFKDPRPPRP